MKRVIFLFSIIILFFSCTGNKHSFFITGDEAQQKELHTLIKSVDEEETNFKKRFILLERITQLYIQSRDLHTMNLLLSDYVDSNPDDPYNSYYLLLIAYNYLHMDSIPFAIHYFERIYYNYSDLLLQNGKSVYYICLEHLIEYTADPELRIEYYKSLISRYTKNKDIGKMYYRIGTTYSQLGEWELALQAYRNFLKYPDASIPEKPNAHDEITEMILYTNLKDKSWIHEDLDVLISKISGYLYKKESKNLAKLGTKIGFFTKSWSELLSEKEQVKRPSRASFSFIDEIGDFMKSRVIAADSLAKESNDQEAFLKTTGWSSYRIRVWYLYFRRINFPADPEIHGKWEWAGIYFGEDS